MTSQNHVIEGSCNLMSELLIACHHPVWWHGPCGSKDVFTLSRDHAKPRDRRVLRLYGKEFLVFSHPLAKFGGHSHCGSRYVFSLSRYLIRPRD